MKRTAVVSVTGDSGRGVSLAKKNAVGAVVAATAAAAASLDSPESGNGAAPYEHERNARIAEKKQTMHALGIGKPAAEIAAAKVEGKSEKKKAGFPTGLAPKADGLRRVGPNACGTSPYAPTLAGAIARTKGRGTGVWV
tara:strand:- start:129 stop:545 length:417 start_codon:yes stop_codon:yes gene_type:complete